MAGTLQFCFKRYEKKDMLTPQQLVQITAGIHSHPRTAALCGVAPSSRCYDTRRYPLIPASFEHPVHHE